MLYYRVILSGPTLDGEAGPLPREHVGLTDADLADFAAVANPCPEHLVGIGYWPVVEVVPEHDPALQRPAATFTDEVDAPNKRVVRTFDLEDVPIVAPEAAAPRPIIAARLDVAPFEVALASGSSGVVFAMPVDVGLFTVYPLQPVPEGAVLFVSATGGFDDDGSPIDAKADASDPSEIWIKCVRDGAPFDPASISLAAFAASGA